MPATLRAYKRVVRVNGQLKIIYIDVDTGQQITDLTGYTIVSNDRAGGINASPSSSGGGNSGGSSGESSGGGGQTDSFSSARYFGENDNPTRTASTGSNGFNLGGLVDGAVKFVDTVGGGGKSNAPEPNYNVIGDESGNILEVIRKFEGFSPTPYWDVNAYRIGYGSDTTTDANGVTHKVTTATRTTREDADRDLERRVSTEFIPSIIKKIGTDAWASLPEPTKAALASVTYNYGSLPDKVAIAVKSGNLESVADAIESLSSHNKGINANRRNEEAALVRYSVGLPQNIGATGKVASVDSYVPSQAAQDAVRGIHGAVQGTSLTPPPVPTNSTVNNGPPPVPGSVQLQASPPALGQHGTVPDIPDNTKAGVNQMPPNYRPQVQYPYDTNAAPVQPILNPQQTPIPPVQNQTPIPPQQSPIPSTQDVMPTTSVGNTSALDAIQMAFLDTLSQSEGSPDYDQAYTYAPINDLSMHPQTLIQGSSAAGKYQINAPTWNEFAKKTGVTDFTAPSQDIVAWAIAQSNYKTKTGRDLYQDLSSSNPVLVRSAFNNNANRWVSLDTKKIDPVSTFFDNLAIKEKKKEIEPALAFTNSAAPIMPKKSTDADVSTSKSNYSPYSNDGSSTSKSSFEKDSSMVTAQDTSAKSMNSPKNNGSSDSSSASFSAGDYFKDTSGKNDNVGSSRTPSFMGITPDPQFTKTAPEPSSAKNAGSNGGSNYSPYSFSPSTNKSSSSSSSAKNTGFMGW